MLREDNAKYQAELGNIPVIDQMRKEIDAAKR